MTDIWTPKQEASRLAERFENVSNKAEFARDNEVPGGPSMLAQHCSGNRPIGLEAAIAYAKGFGVTIDEISPRLAAELRAAFAYLGSEAERGPQDKAEKYKKAPANDSTTLADEIIELAIAYKTAMPKDRPSIMTVAKAAADRATRSRAAPD